MAISARLPFSTATPATSALTDEYGAAAVDKKMHVNDMHATMLYLLGLDHLKLTYQYSGRNIRLTDLAGEVAMDVVA